ILSGEVALYLTREDVPHCFCRFTLSGGRYMSVLQSQKRFLATSANKAFEINHPARFSPLLRSDVGDLAKSRKKQPLFLRLPV
ncbi:MAG: hypothetical protein ACLSB9_29280, partial [Hydrogeniiclostridium mannosilyticum]